ncbi:MAG: DUF2288 family protein [Sandaracinaceae bacterium]|nr:MAG: DUF2288 family protein [Sandaracinaceae bacterium]HBQ19293.1 DUF2288 domain-containing protein [Myxococcales bacterium]
MDDLRQKLEAEILPASWATLTPHAERNALFLVTGETPLADVAVALARDDSAAVEGWVAGGSLRRPTLEELEAWKTSPITFYAVIVAPFVLCKPVDA